MASSLGVVLFFALGIFVLAVVGMALGVLVTGKRLSGSCGGVMGPNGEAVGDCLCARKGANACEKAEPAPGSPLESADESVANRHS